MAAWGHKDSYSLGRSIFTIIGPADREYGELNNYSISIRLTFGSTSFLMCGDTEAEGEDDMLKSGMTLPADVLKISHHGSATGTGEDFLKAVSPSYAVISCGQNNPYHHPARSTLGLLEQLKIPCYVTMNSGTITISSDGQNINIKTEKEPN